MRLLLDGAVVEGTEAARVVRDGDTVTGYDADGNEVYRMRGANPAITAEGGVVEQVADLLAVARSRVQQVQAGPIREALTAMLDALESR